MFSLFARSFLTRVHSKNYNHWGKYSRFDDRRQAEIEAHNTARRRD